MSQCLTTNLALLKNAKVSEWDFVGDFEDELSNMVSASLDYFDSRRNPAHGVKEVRRSRLAYLKTLAAAMNASCETVRSMMQQINGDVRDFKRAREETRTELKKTRAQLTLARIGDAEKRAELKKARAELELYRMAGPPPALVVLE